MDGQRTARIWRTLHQLRAELERSLSYKQRKPVAIRFHSTLNSVIADFEPIAMTPPPEPKPRQEQRPPKNETAAN